MVMQLTFVTVCTPNVERGRKSLMLTDGESVVVETSVLPTLREKLYFYVVPIDCEVPFTKGEVIEFSEDEFDFSAFPNGVNHMIRAK